MGFSGLSSKTLVSGGGWLFQDHPWEPSAHRSSPLARPPAWWQVSHSVPLLISVVDLEVLANASVSKENMETHQIGTSSGSQCLSSTYAETLEHI